MNDEPLNETIGLETASALPDIQPMPKKPYMTPRRVQSLQKARKVKTEKQAVRKSNTLKTKRVLVGLKTMFEGLRKKSHGPVPDKNPTKPQTIGFQPIEAKPQPVRQRVSLIDAPKLVF